MHTHIVCIYIYNYIYIYHTHTYIHTLILKSFCGSHSSPGSADVTWIHLDVPPGVAALLSATSGRCPGALCGEDGQTGRFLWGIPWGIPRKKPMFLLRVLRYSGDLRWCHGVLSGSRLSERNSRCCFFPTCQVRVVGFYVSCPASSFPPDLNCKR